jgi:hypothetical protein
LKRFSGGYRFHGCAHDGFADLEFQASHTSGRAGFYRRNDRLQKQLGDGAVTELPISDGLLEPVALVVSQRDGDRIFIVANKLIEGTVGLAAERFAGATYRDPFAFAGPRDLDLVGRNAVELCNGALYRMVVDVSPVHSAKSPSAVTFHKRQRPHRLT